MVIKVKELVPEKGPIEPPPPYPEIPKKKKRRKEKQQPSAIPSGGQQQQTGGGDQQQQQQQMGIQQQIGGDEQQQQMGTQQQQQQMGGGDQQQQQRRVRRQEAVAQELTGQSVEDQEKPEAETGKPRRKAETEQKRLSKKEVMEIVKKAISKAVEEAEKRRAMLQLGFGRPGVGKSFDVSPRNPRAFRYATTFWRIIDNLVEEETKEVAVFGTTYRFDVRRAMRRKLRGMPPQYVYVPKVKEPVVIILDNSPSMDWWSREVNLIATLAFQRGNVEVYIAPNGEITEKRAGNDFVRVEHDDVVKKLVGRTIIYVGDYDGTHLPVQLSKLNRVIWVCPETRCKEPEEHDWAKNYLRKRRDFNGIFIRALTIDEMLYHMSSISPYMMRGVFDPYEHKDLRKVARELAAS